MTSPATEVATREFFRGASHFGLPEDDVLAERLSQGIGFTRPELAVLLSCGISRRNDQCSPSETLLVECARPVCRGLLSTR